MKNENKLTCAACGGNLDLQVCFDDCDWDSAAGEGSGFGWELALVCECGRVFPIGRLKNDSDFCESTENRRAYGRGQTFPTIRLMAALPLGRMASTTKRGGRNGMTLKERAELIAAMIESGFCTHYPGFVCDKDFPAACAPCITAWFMQNGIIGRGDSRINLAEGVEV